MHKFLERLTSDSTHRVRQLLVAAVDLVKEEFHCAIFKMVS